jgi:hypothetical protein
MSVATVLAADSKLWNKEAQLVIRRFLLLLLKPCPSVRDPVSGAKPFAGFEWNSVELLYRKSMSECEILGNRHVHGYA